MSEKMADEKTNGNVAKEKKTKEKQKKAQRTVQLQGQNESLITLEKIKMAELSSEKKVVDARKKADLIIENAKEEAENIILAAKGESFMEYQTCMKEESARAKTERDSILNGAKKKVGKTNSISKETAQEIFRKAVSKRFLNA